MPTVRLFEPIKGYKVNPNYPKFWEKCPHGHIRPKILRRVHSGLTVIRKRKITKEDKILIEINQEATIFESGDHLEFVNESKSLNI